MGETTNTTTNSTRRRPQSAARLERRRAQSRVYRIMGNWEDGDWEVFALEPEPPRPAP